MSRIRDILAETAVVLLILAATWFAFFRGMP